jgi:ribosome maturation factor RimP
MPSAPLSLSSSSSSESNPASSSALSPAAATAAAAAAALPPDYQDVGTRLIHKAARQCGVAPDQIRVDWRGRGKVVVTVLCDGVFLSSEEEEEEEEGDEFDEDDDAAAAFQGLPGENEWTDEEPPISGKQNEGRVDIAVLARAINAVLEQSAPTHDADIAAGEVGRAIAETHDIEVTTPGASDELVGDVMFRAYKGFDVMVDYRDPKTNKVKQLQGRLHERNEEYTIINVRGQLKKIGNGNVLVVKLPKAKRENV